MKLKNALFFGKIGLSVLASIFSVNAAFSFDKESEDKGYFPSHCQTTNNPPNLRLTYSQNSDQKNEFLVGWNYLENHEFYQTQKPELGGEVVIARCLPPGHYALIAKGQVDKLNGILVEAHVKTTNYDDIIHGKVTENLVESRNLIWRPMVGDEIFPVYKQIQKVVLALPKFKLKTSDLFSKELDGNYSFDLSEEGQNLLREKFSQLKNRNGRLLVEGFILSTGEREKLRTESLMRAQSVATFFMREFALEANQIVTLGFGNDWLKTGMQAIGGPNFRDVEDGIILKML